jgi:hypothetical protein
MEEEDKPVIIPKGGRTKLSEENSAEWQSEFRSVCMENDCWGVIEPTEVPTFGDEYDPESPKDQRKINAKKRKRTVKCKGILLSMLPTRIADIIMSKADVKEMLEMALAEINPKNHTTKWILLKKLMTDSFKGRSLEECLSWIAEEETWN